MLASDYSAWKAFTTAGFNQYEAPNIEWGNGTIINGEPVTRGFGLVGSSGLGNDEEPHFFKVPGSNKIAWYINKSSMAYHANGGQL